MFWDLWVIFEVSKAIDSSTTGRDHNGNVHLGGPRVRVDHLHQILGRLAVPGFSSV